jgi:hypothetical protein
LHNLDGDVVPRGGDNGHVSDRGIEAKPLPRQRKRSLDPVGGVSGARFGRSSEQCEPERSEGEPHCADYNLTIS